MIYFIQGLLEQRHQVEQHLARTESWAEHLDQWRCHVQSVDQMEDKNILQVSLVF